MNEAQTRQDLIDPKLREAGWYDTDGARIRPEFTITKGALVGGGQRSSKLAADYVLQYRNRNVGVIEAKKRDLPYTEGVAQAKDYAGRMQIRFAYATNGLKIYRIDMKLGQEEEVDGFPTPEELYDDTFAEANEWRDKLFSVPFEDKGGAWQPRYYQENAISRVLEAVANEEDRILLTLATGTGKTAISFQIAWKLFHAKWSLQRDGTRRPRILFLADRNVLADQAFNSFGAFDEDALVRIRPSEIKKRGKVQKNGSIFFTIFQTFMSGPNGAPYFGEYPADFFDFIIIDECHRGGASDESSWRAIMEHFSPAVQLGLTATPKRDVNGDTYAYFGEPVYEYSLKAGINDGFLSPFRLKEIHTTIDEYVYTPDDDVEEGDIEVGREYTESDFNRLIEIKEREAYRVDLFMNMIDQSQKALVFCATQRHALAVRDLINQKASTTNVNYCHRVTADDGTLGEQHLRDFQDNEKSIPTILTTSQKLSTGVDAPEVRNIILLRPVNSMVEFKQIIGRGTRLFEGKDYFTVYDFVEAHHHFQDPEWDGPPQAPEPNESRPCKPKEVDGEFVPPNKVEEPRPRMIKVRLSGRKVLELDNMVKTSFWSADGTPISSDQFIKNLFGEIPSLFSSESQLREIWSNPDTRRKLLEELSERGYTRPQLEDLRRLVNGQNSDLYDVLAHVAYEAALVPREGRAKRAKVELASYSPAQQEFLNFVLDQYVRAGSDELDTQKLPDLLELKFGSVSDAKPAIGNIPEIRDMFIGMQSTLYQPVAV
jgi:type I restriction enzyme R subunit